MREMLLALPLACSACAVAHPQPGAASDVLMTATGRGNECLFTLNGEQFVTEQLESALLTARLRSIRGHTVTLQFLADAPYRCFGSAIIALQRAKVKFRTPQFPS